MRLKNLFFLSLFVVVPLIFFYKSIFFGMVPFPGDLLLGNYEPYKSDTNLGLASGSVPHKGQGGDVIRELYPWKHFSIESIKSGEFPLWDPYVFSGTPHFASLQSGTLYPVNVLFFVLPFVDAWIIYIILQYVFLMVFTYLYLRQIGLQKLSSIFGAVSFSFCAFTTVWGEYGNVGHSLAFLPLVLFSIEKILQKQKWYWFVLLIISCSGSILAGYIQLTMYMYILAGVYILSKFLISKKKNIKLYLLLILSLIAGLLLSAVQLLPLYELVSLSLRGNYSYADLTERLLPLESMLTFIVPDFFGNPATHNYFLRGGSTLERASHVGLWTIIFAFFALFTKKTFFRVFFSVSAGVLFLSCLSLPPITYIQSIGIPFLSTGIPTRVLSIVSFCLCVLVAIGFDGFFYKHEKKKILISIVGITALVFIGLWSIVYLIPDQNFLISRRNLILPTGILILGALGIFTRLNRNIIAVLIIGLTVFELFYSFQKFNSFVPRSYVYPETNISKKVRSIQGIDRTWGYGNAYIDSDFAIMEKTYATDGYDALFSKRYGEFLSASENGKIPSEVPRSVANIYKGYGTSDLKQNVNRKRALDLTGTKYVLNKKEDKGIDSAFDEKDFKLISEDRGWQIYENLKSLPRISLYGQYEVVKNKNDIIKRLFSQEFNPLDLVVIEQELSGYDIRQDSSSSADIVSYKPNEIKIKTASNTDQLLFISDTYFPGWIAYVGGKQVPVLVANYTFRAIPVEKGTHEVVVKYSPMSFRTGLWISMGTFLGLIFIILFGTLVKHHAQKNRKK